MPESAELYLGLISGTSADGIDVALASFESEPRLHASLTYPYPHALRRRILALAQGDGQIALDELGALDVDIARVFAEAAQQLLKKAGHRTQDVRALGSHGQTVRHRPNPPTPYTLQLGDANVIAEATGILTVADLRLRDMAAGGQGAPLAPAFHAAMLGPGATPRTVLNLGGIANITVLPGTGSETLIGFDTGPASCLLDAWIQSTLGKPYDADGNFAASGTVNPALLSRLLAEPYLQLPPPKSTGREVFHLRWLEPQLVGLDLAPADVQATLMAFTVRTIADAVQAHAAQASEMLVCGGGTHNKALLSSLAAALAPIPVRSCAVYGIDPDFVEAMLIAWLARERVLGRPAPGIHFATGARGPRVLGALYFGA